MVLSMSISKCDKLLSHQVRFELSVDECYHIDGNGHKTSWFSIDELKEQAIVRFNNSIDFKIKHHEIHYLCRVVPFTTGYVTYLFL